jgi:hypothetical protein
LKEARTERPGAIQSLEALARLVNTIAGLSGAEMVEHQDLNYLDLRCLTLLSLSLSS